MHTYLLEIGFTPSINDLCAYNLDSGAVLPILYVDDTLLSSSDDSHDLHVIEKLRDRFEAVDLGDAKFLLGVGIHQNVHAGTIIISQETYTRTILQTYRMADAHPTKTPAGAGPVQIEEEVVLSTEDTTLFRSATGSHIYLSRCTMPDLAYAAMVLTRIMSKPGTRAMTKIKRGFEVSERHDFYWIDLQRRRRKCRRTYCVRRRRPRR